MAKKNDKQVIAPIAVDFGAKHTGVYYAHYPSGSQLADINKHGEVLTYDKYTVLLRDRTASRHTRRNYDRRKMAKRLLRLVLVNHFDFPADEHTQALGWLLNRRGYNRLEQELNPDYLESFPDKAQEALREVASEMLDEDGYPSEQLLNDLADKGQEHVRKTVNALKGKVSPLRKNLVYYKCINNIRKTIDQLPDGHGKPKKKNPLEKMSAWVIQRMASEGVKGLPDASDNKPVNMLEYFQQASSSTIDKLKSSLPDIARYEKEAKDSIWNFSIEEFDLEKQQNKLDDAEHREHARAHLRHLCHAIWKIHDQMESGHKHRRDYIDEIEKAVEDLSNRREQYLQNFATAIKNCHSLDNDKLHYLISHISNLELKPLRAYFNCKSHQGGDQWKKAKLSEIVRKWFMKQWRVSDGADGKQKVKDYKKLRKLWQGWEHKQDIIGFWLQTNPKLTIPPYQDMSNRHPPRCQTLVLNPDAMDKKYPEWRNWLGTLESDRTRDYRRKLSEKVPNMASDKKANKTRCEQHIDLRVLQFLLDVSKDTDPFRLNEIWSHYHKARQQCRDNKGSSDAEVEMREAIDGSTLPDALKGQLHPDKIAEGYAEHSFGHFINAYYQARRKARDGRYFLHQERKDCWFVNDDKLLSLCPHRPRQKKHQWVTDLAGVLGITYEHLIKVCGGEDKKVEDWLKGLGIASHCGNCTKAQKDYRGDLKRRIDNVIWKRNQGKTLTKDDRALHRLYERSGNLADTIAKELFPDIENTERERRAERFGSVFSFAQIDNIAFRERNGFSNTCLVCSLDNSERMQLTADSKAFASRLPALSIRLIDGAVMRICGILSNHIAKRHWQDIKDDLTNGKVCVPLIMEQNRFEFEPSLASLKRKKKDSDDNREQLFDEKSERIKRANTLCPYKGGSIGKSGEIDHIIPRQSEYGTLNDEANLIYASKKGNKAHTNKEYGLSDLNTEYKHKAFPDCADDNAIKQWITKVLEDEHSGDDSFSFGRYRSFINLNSDEQKAFRHALFLEKDNDLRKRVIRAIDNRNRAIVNGTQRYLAQCIADRLYAMAKQAEVEAHLEFDYFEYTPQSGSDRSTYDLRRTYDVALLPNNTGECLKTYAKQEGKQQLPYSHIVDAQMAFLLAAYQHRKEGSMHIEMPEDFHDDSVFTESAIDPNNADKCKTISMSRAKPKDGVRTHRPFTRSNFYAQNYLDVLLGRQDGEVQVRAGFSWENSTPLAKKDVKILGKALLFSRVDQPMPVTDTTDAQALYDHLEQSSARKAPNGIIRLRWDKKRIHHYLVEHISNAHLANGGQWDDVAEFFGNIAYRTERITITQEDLEKVPDCSIRYNNEKIDLPVRGEWERLSEAWLRWKNQNPDADLQQFLRKRFIEGKANTKRHLHQKARKEFSLPTPTGEGHILQKRNSWTGDDIYQITNDADSRKDGNKPFLKVFAGQRLREVFNNAFVSSDQFVLKKNRELVFGTDSSAIDPNTWWPIDISDDHKVEGVSCIWMKIDNVTRPQIKIKLAQDYSPHKHPNKIKEADYTKAKESPKLLEVLSSLASGAMHEYTGAGFSKPVKEALEKALHNHFTQRSKQK